MSCKYLVQYTCVIGGQIKTGSTPIDTPEPIPSIEVAQQTGLPQVIERSARAEGHQLSNVRITSIVLI